MDVNYDKQQSTSLMAQKLWDY